MPALTLVQGFCLATASSSRLVSAHDAPMEYFARRTYISGGLLACLCPVSSHMYGKNLLTLKNNSSG